MGHALSRRQRERLSQSKPQLGLVTDDDSLYATHGFRDIDIDEISTVLGTKVYTALKVRITPQLAQELLDLNRNNRPVTPARVIKCQLAMAAGRWEPRNGSSISLNENGDVDNGQHRLLACVKSGKPFFTLLVVNTAPKAYQTIDKVKPRSEADTLRQSGVVKSREIAAALRILWWLAHGGDVQKAAPEMESGGITAYLEKHPGLIDSATVVDNCSKLRRLGPPSVMITTYCLFAARDPEKARQIFEWLETGLGMEETNPFWRLREYLLDPRKDRRGAKDSQLILALFFKAWNILLEGRPCRHLSWRRDGKTPEAFPVLK